MWAGSPRQLGKRKVSSVGSGDNAEKDEDENDDEGEDEDEDGDDDEGDDCPLFHIC